VEQPQEAAAEPEAERIGAVGREGEGTVVEAEALQNTIGLGWRYPGSAAVSVSPAATSVSPTVTACRSLMPVIT
jgi:hypothetical protein